MKNSFHKPLSAIADVEFVRYKCSTVHYLMAFHSHMLFLIGIDILSLDSYNNIAVDSFQQEGGATSAIHNRFSYLCCGRYSLLLYL